MNNFEVNLHGGDIVKEFINLDQKDIFAVNQWLFKNRKNLSDIEGDYLVAHAWEKEESYDLYDLNFKQFIEKYIKHIKDRKNEGFDTIVEIIDEYENEMYKGILNISEDEKIYIFDKYSSCINIVNAENYKVKVVSLIKRISKKLLITVGEFINEIDNCKILNNSKINLTLEDQSMKSIVIRVSNYKVDIDNSQDIDKYKDSLVISFRVNYR